MARNWIERAAWVAEQMYPRIAARGGYPNPARAEGDHPTASTQPPHLLWMCLELVGRRLDSETKACRWLGWVQACAVVLGYYTMDDLRILNLASANGNLPEAE